MSWVQLANGERRPPKRPATSPQQEDKRNSKRQSRNRRDISVDSDIDMSYVELALRVPSEVSREDAESETPAVDTSFVDLAGVRTGNPEDGIILMAFEGSHHGGGVKEGSKECLDGCIMGMETYEVEEERWLGSAVIEPGAKVAIVRVRIPENAEHDASSVALPPLQQDRRGRMSGLTWKDGSLIKRQEDRMLYATPPHFDYKMFEEEHVPSDKLVVKMFPNDPEGRTKWRDLHVEHELLGMLNHWTIETNVEENCGTGHSCSHCDFHNNLARELEIDLQDVGDELDNATGLFTGLQIWQAKHLDMDGELKKATTELRIGKDIFSEPGGREALNLYGHILQHLERMPADDIETWEYFHLGKNGTITRRNLTMTQCGILLEPGYFGAAPALLRYGKVFSTLGYLDSASFEELIEEGVDALYMLDDLEKEAAMAILGHAIDDLSRVPTHDIETWRHFHFADTKQLRKKLRMGKRLFDSQYFGGKEAAVEYGRVCGMLKSMDDQSVVEELAQGINPFHLLETEDQQIARAVFKDLLDEMSRLPSDDLETWKFFHLGNLSQFRKKMRTTDGLFDARYFGGTFAASEYSAVCEKLKDLDDGDIERQLLRGIDPCHPISAQSAEIEDAARAVILDILEKLPRVPRHDLETWKYHHIGQVRIGLLANTRRRLRIIGMEVFQPEYFGSFQARDYFQSLSTLLLGTQCTDGGLQDILARGVDPFFTFDLPEKSTALSMIEDILVKLPFPPLDDLETWEQFHLGKCGTICKPNNMDCRGYISTILQRPYYGGPAASRKYEGLYAFCQRLTPREIMDRLLRGQDVFRDLDRRGLAPTWREMFASVLEDLSVQPNHDLATWEMFQLRPGGPFDHPMCRTGLGDVCTGVCICEIPSSPFGTIEYHDYLFEPPFFGAEHARAKYGALFEEVGNEHIGRIQRRMLAGEDVLLDLSEAVRGPMKDLFSSKWARLPHPLENDLETWEKFHVDEDGIGTTKLEAQLATGKDPFAAPYFGGIKARLKWGYVKWERYMLDKNGNIREVQRLYDHGLNIFVPERLEFADSEHWDIPEWASESARCKYDALLPMVNSAGKKAGDDLETWEWFHLDKAGSGGTRIALMLANGQDPFTEKYFGGIEARAKWGHLKWERIWLDDDGSTVRAEWMLRRGIDIFHPADSGRFFGLSYDCQQWSQEAAARKHGSLLHKLERQPKHDLETWEWFNCPNGDTANIELRLQEGKWIFDGYHFGGVQARAKYGYLAPDRMKADWSDEELCMKV